MIELLAMVPSYVWIIIAILWMHFVADFFLQSDEMAKGKSSSNLWLFKHVTVYTLAFMYMGSLGAVLYGCDVYVHAVIAYSVINGMAHFVTDYFTSRWTSALWKKGDTHNFFVVIGFDQAVHLTTLILTYELMIGF